MNFIFFKKRVEWEQKKRSSKCLVCARPIQLNHLENVIFCSKTNSIIKSHAKCSLLNNLSVVIAIFFPDIMLRYWYLAFDNVNFNWYFVNYEWQAQAGKYGQTEFSRISSRCMLIWILHNFRTQYVMRCIRENVYNLVQFSVATNMFSHLWQIFFSLKYYTFFLLSQYLNIFHVRS